MQFSHFAFTSAAPIQHDSRMFLPKRSSQLSVESTPHPGCQWQMKTYGDFLIYIPGGDWHHGLGVDPNYHFCLSIFQDHES